MIILILEEDQMECSHEWVVEVSQGKVYSRCVKCGARR